NVEIYIFVFILSSTPLFTIENMPKAPKTKKVKTTETKPTRRSSRIAAKKATDQKVQGLYKGTAARTKSSAK
ncbi:2114_t:CDS:1, partial [Acaulospora morrowiae]